MFDAIAAIGYPRARRTTPTTADDFEMGLDINTATLLQEWILRYAITGPVLTLGVQKLDFTWEQFARATGQRPPQIEVHRAVDAKTLFRDLGIYESFSLDISDHEGADFLFDLNDAVPPPHLVSRFGAVVNGGTIEHVFNISNAMTAITRMLRPGGLVIHIVPIHNWIDHGFYQINPTLLFDYYSAARFDILESAALVFAVNGARQCDVIPVPPGILSSGRGSPFGDRTMLGMFAARKTTSSLDQATPIQSIYAREPTHPPSNLRWFVPYSAVDGIRNAGQCTPYVLGPFRPEDGSAWIAALPHSIAEGDIPEAPARSRLILFEDERLLGPAHALHAIIRSYGGGSYSHWHDCLFFSSSDGSDPNCNGRRYIAVLPR